MIKSERTSDNSISKQHYNDDDDENSNAMHHFILLLTVLEYAIGNITAKENFMHTIA